LASETRKKDNQINNMKAEKTQKRPETFRVKRLTRRRPRAVSEVVSSFLNSGLVPIEFLDLNVRMEIVELAMMSDKRLITSEFDQMNVGELETRLDQSNLNAEILLQIGMRYIYGFGECERNTSYGMDFIASACSLGHPLATSIFITVEKAASPFEEMYGIKLAERMWKETGHVLSGFYFALQLCNSTYFPQEKSQREYAIKICKSIWGGKPLTHGTGLELLTFYVDAFFDEIGAIERNCICLNARDILKCKAASDLLPSSVSPVGGDSN
jgi:hypothetical protein